MGHSFFFTYSLYPSIESWQKGAMSFKTQIKIHFDEADPAGIAFSGHIFTKVHRCYEEFIEELGQNPSHFFLKNEILVPIRHVEIDYLGPLLPFKSYPVVISVLKISTSSFQLQFSIFDGTKLMSKVKSTHVCCDKQSMEKCEIPSLLKESLQKFVIPQ
jgi:acyl-CoA thioesterase FadM